MWTALYKKIGSLFAIKSRGPGLYPENQYKVEANSERISVVDPTGARTAIEMANLEAVLVETNDTGPWGMDVWYIFVGADGKDQCWFPQGATNEDAALDLLSQLPGFEIAGMNCTENARHLCWQRTKKATE